MLAREQKPLANSQQGTEPSSNHMRELESGFSIPIEPWDACSPSQQLECNLIKDLEAETPSSVAPRFLTLRNCNITRICCFKLRNLKIISYTTVGTYSHWHFATMLPPFLTMQRNPISSPWRWKPTWSEWPSWTQHLTNPPSDYSHNSLGKTSRRNTQPTDNIVKNKLPYWTMTCWRWSVTQK